MLSNQILKPTKVDHPLIAPSNKCTPISNSIATNKNTLDNSSTTNVDNQQDLLSFIDVNLKLENSQIQSVTTPPPLPPSNQTSSQLAPLDIDLSYFEKKIEPNSSNSSFSSSSSSSSSSKNESSNISNNQKMPLNHLNKQSLANKKEPNAKIYLDKLLQDIFMNKNNNGNNNNNTNNSNQVTLVKSNSASTFNQHLTAKSDIFPDKKCNLK